MKTVQEMMTEHPNWNQKHVESLCRLFGGDSQRDEFEFIMMESMMEIPCVKCGVEMGEHDIDFNQRERICPK